MQGTMLHALLRASNSLIFLFESEKSVLTRKKRKKEVFC